MKLSEVPPILEPVQKAIEVEKPYEGLRFIRVLENPVSCFKVCKDTDIGLSLCMNFVNKIKKTVMQMCRCLLRHRSHQLLPVHPLFPVQRWSLMPRLLPMRALFKTQRLFPMQLRLHIQWHRQQPISWRCCLPIGWYHPLQARSTPNLSRRRPST